MEMLIQWSFIRFFLSQNNCGVELYYNDFWASGAGKLTTRKTKSSDVKCYNNQLRALLGLF